MTFLVGSLALGGTERQLVALANRLDRDRFEPEVVTWYGSDELSGELLGEISRTNLGLNYLAGAGAADAVRVVNLVGRLASHFRRHQPAIVHAFLFSAYGPGALAARLAGVPVTIAGRRGLHGYSHLPAPARLLGRRANRLIAGHLCNSSAVATWIRDHEPEVPPDRIFVVPNGIEAPGSAALPSGWRGEGPLAACVANFHPYKGHATVLRALALVPGLRLVLIGHGPGRASAEQLALEFGVTDRVVFAGSRPDAAALLGGFDFTLLASDQEGMPNVVMESMVLGVPVIATAVGGSAELIRDGVDGLLVPPANPELLAARMRELAADCALRERLGAAAREAMVPYSQATMARRVEAVYDRLLNL